MSSNTITRIISSLVIMALLGLLFYLGKFALLGLFVVAMMIIIDEIFRNFLNEKRNTFNYIFAQLSLLIPYTLIFFVKWETPRDILAPFIHWAILNNLFLLIYLFAVPLKDFTLVERARKRPYLIGLFYLPTLISIGALLQFEMWERYLLALFVINYAMDTGGWFFGKLFGKHKLWPSISPKKTVEGLIGGMLTSACLGSLFWHFAIHPVNYFYLWTFGFFAFVSQMGDLIQSKLKRQCDIKDSSKMIPGHGGLYDRLDSLIFLAPFFVAALRYMKGYYLL